ncbi:lactonase family protein [Devosia sp. 2618]|uniref:lactonase family protein n=1 Tax=Devosia sp. 2618 TaxID=3156454 RepID=UPI00339AFA01
MSIENLVYVGTYSEQIRFGTGQLLDGKGKGIYRFRFDPATASLTLAGITEGVRNASYLCFDAKREFLYCVNEMKEWKGQFGGGLSAYRIDQETGELTFLNDKPSMGTDPCHIILDKTGKFVFVANFASGSFIGYNIEADGSLGDECAFVQHAGTSIDPVRQIGPHAHAVEFDGQGRFVYVPDLGMDKVMVYELDTSNGSVKPAQQPFVSVKPGAGPRQLVMHPKGRFAYLINELNSTMTAYAYDKATGGLIELQTLSTLPEGYTGKTSCAEVQITPDGKFLYGSNRGHNSLAIYAVDAETGRLTAIGHESTRGEIPRNFEVSSNGQFLIAANQDSDNLVPFRLDPATGKLTPGGEPVEAGTPICVRFV